MEGRAPSEPITPGLMAGGQNGFIGKDEFFGVFSFAFMAGHGVTGLQSLNIESNRTARPASDALYEICEETPSLHFLIKPGGKWLERAMAIGMFAVPVAMGCRAELAQRRAARMAEAEGEGAGQASPAANDNGKAAKPSARAENDIMAEFENAA